MRALLAELQAKFPALQFTAGEQFSWSPETTEIIYEAGAKGPQAGWSLLHETGHALLKHSSYHSDVELLKLELAAWEHARHLATKIGITINDDHIQDSLDTYRDWLYTRSICPDCGTKCLQQGDFVHYRCFNCHAAWKTSVSRFCRVYRRRKYS